ncbi:MAG TPA: FIST C-terminal domain-containing protein [Phycisphaerae bacterium]|nr:FIST C-terminal domain-containing protein [Phycisphaerae bacterium]
MTAGKHLWVGLAVAAMLAGPAAALAGEIVVACGHSEKKDPAGAGAEAAEQAKAALKGAEAKVVLVFDSLGGKAEIKQKMLDAIAKSFDASKLYGCSSYNAITPQGGSGMVGVLALAGAIKADAALADLTGGHEACGKKIGEAIQPAVEKTQGKGRLLVLIGDCHVPKNNDVVKGVCGVLGEKFPVAGGAAMGGFTYCKGKVALQSNLGLLLSGDFTCSFSLKGAKGKEPMDVVNAAGEAFRQAIGEKTDDLVMVFAFDCGGRRGQMGKDRPKELELMKAAAGTAPIFGFYGSGETGPPDNDSPSRGVGYHICACAIRKK